MAGSWGKFFVLGGRWNLKSSAIALVWLVWGKWHKHCVSEDLSPSSVAYGATFPLEGEGYGADFFCFCFEMLTSDI